MISKAFAIFMITREVHELLLSIPNNLYNYLFFNLKLTNSRKKEGKTRYQSGGSTRDRSPVRFRSQSPQDRSPGFQYPPRSREPSLSRYRQGLLVIIHHKLIFNYYQPENIFLKKTLYCLRKIIIAPPTRSRSRDSRDPRRSREGSRDPVRSREGSQDSYRRRSYDKHKDGYRVKSREQSPDRFRLERCLTVKLDYQIPYLFYLLLLLIFVWYILFRVFMSCSLAKM